MRLRDIKVGDKVLWDDPGASINPFDRGVWDVVRIPDLGDLLPNADDDEDLRQLESDQVVVISQPEGSEAEVLLDELHLFRACIGSGYCCMKSQCQLSVEKHGHVKGACPELKWDGERHLCGLMLKEETSFYSRAWLGEGQGCCSPLNSWRREPLKDRRHLDVL